MASRWTNYSPDPTPEGEPTGPVEEPGKRAATGSGVRRPRPRPRSAATVRRPHASPVGVAIAVAAVLAVLGGAAWLAVLGSEDVEPSAPDVPTSAPPSARQPSVDAHSAAGLAELAADLRAEVGHTVVREVVVYPTYAVIDVPWDVDDPGDEREVSYYWDGDLRESAKGTSSERPFDLRRIDGSRLADQCARARTLVEDPTGCYLILRRPHGAPRTGWTTAHTSNEFGQGGYVVFDLGGTEVLRRTW